MDAPKKKAEARAKPVADPDARPVAPAEAVEFAKRRFPKILARLAK